MLRKKLKQYFSPFGSFIKSNWKMVSIIQLLVLITSFSGYSTLPFLRAINPALGIVFAVIYTTSAITSFVLINKTITHYYKSATIKDEHDKIRFFYFFLTLILSGIIMTMILIIIRAINPDSQFLIQGFVGIALLLIYYLLFGFVIYFDKFIDYFKFKKNKKE